ncbi:MAG: exodeoxyribonuclease III [Thermodesulfobacteriota bacterium]
MGVFKAASFNVNSIRARVGTLQEWLRREQPDVLCLQETKSQDKDFPGKEFKDLGYRVAFRGQKSYNGVAILSPHPMTEITKGLYGNEAEEARFISAVIQGVSVLNAYVPQGVAVGTERFQYKLQWLGDLLEHLRTQHKPASRLLLMGDFNVALEPIDVYDPEAFRGQVCFHPDEQAMLRRFLDWGLVDVFRKHHPEGGHYTFWDYRIPNALKRKMGWRIDYILASRALAAKSRDSRIDIQVRMAAKPSDHTFLIAEFDL